MSNRQGLILLAVLIMLCVSGTTEAASGIKAYSMLTHDGRRLVSHVERTNTVFELVHTNALPANLPPVREWTLYAVKSAHTDIGLHNSQYIQRHGTVRRIDEARRLIAADPDDSDPAAFRYVAEGAWFWGNYPLDRGEAEAMAVVTNEIARGRLDVGVTCAGNHTHLYGFEELCRSIYTKRELQDRWGIKTRTMLMTDNPGISWSIVAPYAEAGVEHVLFSPNHWNPHPSTIWKMDKNRPWSRNNPDAGGGGSRIDVRWDSAIPMLFWWQAPQSDARLLVWTCPHYGRGGEPFGIITAWKKMKPMEKAEPMMARQLAKMEARYPYDVWLFADYEDDEWPSTRQADLFKQWNAKWKWPQLRTCGRLDEPFDRVKARWGDKIPTLCGEMTSGWLQHAACTPELLARKMAADRALARAETLMSVISSKYKEVPSYKEAYPAEDFRRAWDALIWNDEHSYGVSGYKGRRVFETWMQHRDWIERAEHIALDGIQRAIPGMIIHNGNPNPVICRVGTTENRWYRVAVTNGVIYSIYDKELKRELLEGPANEFRYTRDNHKTWMTGDKAARALGAEMVQKVWLSQDEKKIVLETTFRHARDLFNTNRYDRFGYMAFPFAVPQFRFVAQLNGPVIDPLRDQSGLTSDAYTAVRDWCAVENGEFGVALVMADSCLTEFGEIHPDKTCYGGPVKSSGIYPYLFTDWLQMHNPDGDSFNFRFRYVITSYSGTWQSAHIPAFADRALDDLDDKYYGCYLPLSRYDLSVDSPAWNVQLLTLKRAEDGRGLIARFRESEGRPCRVTASQHLAPDAEYTLCNVIERDVRKLDGFAFDLAPFGYATIRIDAPSLRFATRPPDDSAYAYTGLITAPRAGHGEKDGQMYILWGSEMSPDFDHYELWRDGKFLANVTNEVPNGIPYRVARYVDLGLPTHSRHEYRIRKVWKDGRKDPLGEPFWGLTRSMSEDSRIGAPLAPVKAGRVDLLHLSHVHRGGGKLERPDNTLETFKWCWENGSALECDCRKTKDGVGVMLHDDNLKRTGRGISAALASKSVSKELTWDEIKDVDVGSYLDPKFAHHRIPTIEATFAAMKGHPTYLCFVDEKGAGPKYIAAKAKEAGVLDQVYYTGQNYQKALDWNKATDGGKTLIWIGTWPRPKHTAEDIARFEAHFEKKMDEMRANRFKGVSAVSLHTYYDPKAAEPFVPRASYLKKIIAEFHANGKPVCSIPFEGGETEDVYFRLHELGCDGFSTDYPSVMFSVIRKLKARTMR